MFSPSLFIVQLHQLHLSQDLEDVEEGNITTDVTEEKKYIDKIGHDDANFSSNESAPRTLGQRARAWRGGVWWWGRRLRFRGTLSSETK